MSKYVNLEDEKTFIAYDAKIKATDKLLSALKIKFGKLFDKGYKFKLLTPKPSEGRFAPPWKQIANDLAEQYMTKSEFRKWEKKLAKDYPPTPVATSFIILKEG